jgi:hypothetical protein
MTGKTGFSTAYWGTARCAPTGNGKIPGFPDGHYFKNSLTYSNPHIAEAGALAPLAFPSMSLKTRQEKSAQASTSMIGRVRTAPHHYRPSDGE